MYNITDRRNFKRFIIPNAKVKYEQEDGFHESKNIVGFGKLVDLSEKAVKFEAMHKLTPGAKSKVEILLADGQIISLLGNILWSSSRPGKKAYLAVVEFIDFSADTGFNSIENKLALQYLSEKYEPVCAKVVFNL